MRYLAVASLVSLSLGALAFSACSSSNSSSSGGGAGGTGGKTDGGGGTIITGGGGAGNSGGGSGGSSASGGSGNTGGSGGSATCQAQGETCQDNCFDLGCDPGCTQAGDPTAPCCSDYQSACVANAVTLPAGCVNAAVFLAMCNPVSNDPCGAGNACDKAGADQYWTGVACYGGDNTAAVGAACDPKNQKYCVGGATCDVPSGAQTGTCKKWCCADTDCSGGTCAAIDPTNLGTLGLCESGTDGGTGGAGGTGGSAGAAGSP